MKKLLCGIAVATVGLVGCTKESKPGGPGAKTTPPTVVERMYKTPDSTFTLSVPAGELDLDRGERKEVTISIERGKDFNQDVKLTFKMPTGLTVSPAETTLKAGESGARVVIEAATDAPEGEVSIEVIGTPTTGEAVSMTIKTEVHD